MTDPDLDQLSGMFELAPIGGVRVLVVPQLREVLATGAELRFGGPSFSRHLWLALDRPEAWLDFLDRHPYRH